MSAPSLSYLRSFPSIRFLVDSRNMSDGTTSRCGRRRFYYEAVAAVVVAAAAVVVEDGDCGGGGGRA